MQQLTLLTIASWLYLLLASTTTVVHAANAAAMVCPNTEATDNNVENTIDAQAYKPNAPIKTRVCEESNDGSSGGGPHKLAHWSFWRSNYKDLIPISFTGNIYSCNSSSGDDDVKPITTTTNNEDSLVVMEVWQPRPDGTYSSIRPGVEEGDCRASVPITIFTHQQQHDDENENENSNVDGRIGTVKFDTFIPGSTGILNGLVPSSSSSSSSYDYPPYKSGSIHLFLNIQGFNPLVVSLGMNELESWFPKRHYVGKKRFQLSVGDKKKKKIGNNGMEIQSVTPKTAETKSRSSAGKYNLAIDLEVNLFLTKSNNNHDDNKRKKKEGEAAGDGDTSATLQDIFCSKKKKSLFFGRIISFFKEPISVCSPAYLDFFAL